LDTPVRPSAVRAFRAPDYRRFLGSRVLSIFALEMVSVAVAWQVYGLTHRPIDLGYVGLAQFLPAVFLTLPAGHTADRFDRRRVVLLCHLAFGVCAALLAALAFQRVSTPLPIFVVLLLLGTARAFNAPAAQALMPSLVPAGDFQNAVAWNSSSFQVASVAGPALGGVLYALLGNPELVYLVAMGMAVVDATVLLGIRTRTGRMESRDTSWSTVLAGVKYVWENKVVLGSISLDLFAVLLGGAVALMPVFAHDVLRTGAWGLGLLRAAPAVGAGVGLCSPPSAHPAGAPDHAPGGGVRGSDGGLRLRSSGSLGLLVVMGASDMLGVFARPHPGRSPRPPRCVAG
jgi:MFS family permease